MNLLSLGSALLPDAVIPSFSVLLITLAGLLIVVGLRKVALSLMGVAVIALVSPVVFAPLIDAVITALPIWLLVLLALGIFLALTARFWRAVLVQAFGRLLADFIRWMVTSRIALGFLAMSILGGYLWLRFA